MISEIRVRSAAQRTIQVVKIVLFFVLSLWFSVARGCDGLIRHDEVSLVVEGENYLGRLTSRLLSPGSE